MSDTREESRQSALTRALSQIEKSFGKGAIMYLKDQPNRTFDGISTGALSIDLALGGGIPRGRVLEIFGPESSGKTTLTLHIIAEAQRAGGAAAFIDVEHAFDPAWAKRLGVNLEELMVNQPSCGEEALEVCELLVRSNALDVIVIDSVAALVPRHELEGQMGDAQVGAQARLMSQALRKLTGIASKSRTSVLFINQLREKIGVMYGSPETTPGGRALKFYSSVRIDVRRTGMLKEGEQVIGSRIRTKIVKNKVAPPFREAEIDIYFDCGISRETDLIDVASEIGVLSKTGTWFSYGETRLGQGRENARQYLRDNPALFKEIREKTLAAKMPKPEAGETPEKDVKEGKEALRDVKEGADRAPLLVKPGKNSVAPAARPAPISIAAASRKR
ncbi:Protein RecA [Phycisphaerae bacterium RAS1]|nr:Protein RecA [Phycisphaerae bacterium RAS1]